MLSLHRRFIDSKWLSLSLHLSLWMVLAVECVAISRRYWFHWRTCIDCLWVHLMKVVYIWICCVLHFTLNSSLNQSTRSIHYNQSGISSEWTQRPFDEKGNNREREGIWGPVELETKGKEIEDTKTQRKSEMELIEWVMDHEIEPLYFLSFFFIPLSANSQDVGV